MLGSTSCATEGMTGAHLHRRNAAPLVVQLRARSDWVMPAVHAACGGAPAAMPPSPLWLWWRAR